MSSIRPRDRLIWDVGHQAYPHKILTGRRDRIRTLRQGGGLSGFTRRSESEYDPFGAAHSSTSISAALGFAIANKLAGAPGKAIAVIGDGAMSAGMAYEAMNNAAAAGNRLIVILNDNDMSIAPPVGGLCATISRGWSRSGKYLTPAQARPEARRASCPSRCTISARQDGGISPAASATGGTLFEELGFYYVGPVDGHNVERLVEVLENVRDADEGPMLVHVVTKKGKGYAPGRERRGQISRRRQKFDVVSGVQAKAEPGAAELHRRLRQGADRARRSATTRWSRSPRRCRPGTGLDKFARRIPRADVRRRHRRAACGDLRRRPRRAGLSAVLRHLFDLPAARLRPGRPRRRDPESAGALRHGPRRAGRRRRRDPCRQLRSRLSRHLAEFRRDGGGRRGRARPHGPHHGAARQRPDRGPLSARQRHRRRRFRQTPQAARDRQGPDRPRGQEGRDPVARHAARGGAEGRRGAGGEGPVDDGRGPALRQAARRAN